MYTLLHPSKSHLWIRRFLESGDSDLLWRLVLSILNGEIELEKEKVDLNGEQYSTLFGSTAMTPEAHSLQLHRLKVPCPHFPLSPSGTYFIS